MKLVAFRHDGADRIGVMETDAVLDLTAQGAPDSLDQVLASGALEDLRHLAREARTRIALDKIQTWLPPVRHPGKAIAVGLNYVDHAAEGNMETPTFPVLFSRYPSSWVGHGEAILHPKVGKALDYEGELVAVIGRGGRHIAPEAALSHVAGYSIFNEGSVRDWQMRTHQWTIGKNFDRSGSFGPCLVTADALPAGAKGLRLQTRLNGKLLQDADTADMIFDVATLVSVCSAAFALAPGDLIITGTPSGVGGAQKPPLFMKPGDVCDVSIEGIGVLSNRIEAEA